MGKRDARGAPAASPAPQAAAAQDEASDDLFEVAELDEDSEDLEQSDSDISSDGEAGPGTGVSGLDAIIRASRRSRSSPAAPATIVEEGAADVEARPLEQPHSVAADADDEDPHSNAAENGALDKRGRDADAAAKEERRRSGQFASSSALSLLRDEAFLADAGSDSSEDERPDRNTIGNVPLEWYNEEEHIGYDREGKALAKKGKSRDMLDLVLSRNDTPGLALRTIYDPYNDEELVLSREELRTLMNIQQGKLPELSVDPYEDLIDWYSNEVDAFPMRNAPEPKRRFMPSKHEEKKVLKLIRAIRRGWIKPPKDKEGDEDDAEGAAPPVYMLWNDDGNADTSKTGAGLSYIPPPKPELPGHEESFNPPREYLPTDEQRAAYDKMDDEDKPDWIPRVYDSLRQVPQYERVVHERFERCLDLYLCPRVRSKRINYKAEDLVPKSLPKPTDLRPFPNVLCVTYVGHRSKIRSLDVDATGQWLLTGGDDGTMRLWEVLTGRCVRTWSLGAKVHCVAWCPRQDLRIASAVLENKAVLVHAGVGGAAAAAAAEAALKAPPPASESEKVLTRWVQRDGGGLDVVHSHSLRRITWHSRGDYFATVAPGGASQSVTVHQLSKHSSQNPFRKNRGRVTSCTFHPSKPFFLVSTENNVRIYNLAKHALAKKLLAGGGVITSLAVHHSGDHVLVGTEDKRCLWFDLDLSSKPYKVMKYHEAAVRGTAFHAKYPLFASASDDATVQVFHGMVYADLLTNPLIVPVKILKGHAKHEFSGVTDVAFHPQQPWVFTAGGDGKACLFVDV